MDLVQALTHCEGQKAHMWIAELRLKPFLTAATLQCIYYAPFCNLKITNGQILMSLLVSWIRNWRDDWNTSKNLTKLNQTLEVYMVQENPESKKRKWNKVM